MATPSHARQTFMRKAARTFRQNTSRQFGRANKWRRNATGSVHESLTAINDWLLEYKVGVIITLGIIIWLALMIWFIADAASGNVKGNAFQVGAGGLVGGAIVGLIVSPVIGIAAFLCVLLLNLAFRVAAGITLFLPIILWAPVYAAWQVAVVCAKLLLLVPLFFLFLATRAVQLWRGILYTCPSRKCAYRGLPAYVCPKCGAVNEKLWPNFYGLLWHECGGCEERLPALEALGRRKLERRCGDASCRMPLHGRHAGRAPERLVAIVGGPGSGKTCFLLMLVHHITKSVGAALGIRGEIDDPLQEKEFEREWEGISGGRPPGKTADVPTAFLLYSKVGRKKCQLYLYDAPGEEFCAVSSMSKQQYLHLIEGFVLLIDPTAVEAVSGKEASRRKVSFKDVVDATLGKVLAEIPARATGKVPLRVAVVISRADIKGVRGKIGDIREGQVSNDTCRQALIDWGAGGSVRLIESRFESVAYFACSQLGREVSTGCRDAFKGSGVVEPLLWVLGGRRNGAK